MNLLKSKKKKVKVRSPSVEELIAEDLANKRQQLKGKGLLLLSNSLSNNKSQESPDSHVSLGNLRITLIILLVVIIRPAEVVVVVTPAEAKVTEEEVTPTAITELKTKTRKKLMTSLAATEGEVATVVTANAEEVVATEEASLILTKKRRPTRNYDMQSSHKRV